MPTVFPATWLNGSTGPGLTAASPPARAPAPVSERQLQGTGPAWPPPTGLPGREGEHSHAPEDQNELAVDFGKAGSAK